MARAVTAGSADEWRRRVAGWRAAERRERTLRQREGPMAPAVALEAALELSEWAIAAGADDVARTAATEQARAAWQRLRMHLVPLPTGRPVR